MYLEEKLNPKDHKHLWQQIPDFTVIKTDTLLRKCEPDEFWNTPVGAVFDRDKIMKFRDDEREIIRQVPKWKWDDIFTYVDKVGTGDVVAAM